MEVVNFIKLNCVSPFHPNSEASETDEVFHPGLSHACPSLLSPLTTSQVKEAYSKGKQFYKILLERRPRCFPEFNRFERIFKDIVEYRISGKIGMTEQIEQGVAEFSSNNFIKLVIDLVLTGNL